MAMSACNKQTQKEQKTEQFEDAFNTSQELQEKAVADSGFANSAEYRSQMEKASIEMSKKTFDMNVNEKLLLEFEISLNGLKQYTDRLKQHPELSKDASFVKKVQAKAGKVREYHESLKKVNLNPKEKEKFNELSYQ